jgi:hypothetical protein
LNIKKVDNNTFIIKINSWINDYEEYDNEYKIKELIHKIGKKYNYNIYGIYNVNISELKKFLKIVRIEKIDEDDFYRNRIDLMISKNDSELFMLVNDFTLLDSYNYKKISDNMIKGSTIKEDDIIKLCEHYCIRSLNLQ